MYLLVTLTVLMQLLPAGITAQSTVADLSASASPDHSALTLGIESLTPTPVLSSGVALASVTASPPVVVVDSGGSQTLASVLYTSHQAISPTVSNGGGQNSISDQTFSSTEANGGARNSISDQNAYSTTANTGSSIHSDNQFVSSHAGQDIKSSYTGERSTVSTTEADSTADVSMVSGSDHIVPVAPSVFVSTTPMVSAVDATDNIPASTNHLTPSSSNVNDVLASAGSTVAIINPAPSASQIAETSLNAVESSFNRGWSSTVSVSTRNALASMMESVSSATHNTIISSTIQETHLPTLVSSAYIDSSLIQNFATVPLHTSKDLVVITSTPMLLSIASSQTVVNNLTDTSSPTYNMVSSSPFISQGEASSELLDSYSAMFDITSNLDGVSLTSSVPISPTQPSSIVQSDVQTTMPIVLDSSAHMSALSSNVFSQHLSSVAGSGSSQSSQSIMSPVIPTLVLTSESATVSLPVMSTMSFGQSSSLTPTDVILPSSALPIISARSSSDNLSSFISSVDISEISPSIIADSASYSMPLLVSPTVMGTSTFLYSSMFVPPTYVTDSSASLSGTISSIMTPVLSDLLSVSGSVGGSGPIMNSTRTLNVTDVLPHMSPSTISSPYMLSSSVSLNVSAVFPTLTMLASSPSMYQTPTLSVYQSSPSINLPIIPSRSSGYTSSIFPPIMLSSSINFFSPRPVSDSSGSLPSMIPPMSARPTGSASSVIISDFIRSVSLASDYHMTSSLNISFYSLSSVAPSTNFPPMPFSSTNITGSSLTIVSSVIPSFTYSTDMYTSTASTPLLVSPTPHSAMINLTRSVSILTPTELPLAPSNMNTVNGTLSASFSTNSIYTTMAVTNAYTRNMTLMTSSAILATSGVNSTALLPTAVHPTSITPTTSTMNYTSTLEASTSLSTVDNASVLAPGSTMSSMVIPASTTFMSSMTSTTSSLMQSSLIATVVTEPTIFSSISSSQEPSSPAVVVSTPSMTLSSNMTSAANLLSPLETASSVLPTPSDMFSSNTTTQIHNTSAPLMSSSLSVNATSTHSTSTHSTSQMSSAVTMPTSSDVTTPATANVTTTPALNVTVAPSISTMPSAIENVTSTPALNVTISPSITTTPSSVENVTSSDNVTSVNVTMTMAVNMTSMISGNTTNMMSTSVVPVTTTPAPTTTSTTTEPPTTTSSFIATFWTVTDIQVPVSVNVSGDDFVNKMEFGLANLYVTAYTRKRDIDASSFDSRKKRKRRRRTATVDDIMVTMQDVKRDPAGPETVSMMYTVEKAELPVPSAVNAETINLVSDQEMAIELRYVVTKKAKPLNWVEPVTTTTTTVATTAVPTDNTQTWIIAVVAGGVVILVVIAIVGLCIALKKSKKSGVEEEAEPRLMNLKNAPLDDEEEDIRSSGRSNSKYSSMTDKGSASNLKVQSPKKQSYEVTSDTRSKEEDEHLYAEVKKTKKPDLASRIGRSQGSQDFLGSENMAEDVELIESSKKKKGEKGRRKNKRKDGDTEDDNEVITKTIHPASLLVPQSQHFLENAYYSAEEEDELKQRKAAERKKNKQRIREKKKKEKRQDKSADQLMVEYLAAQEEIDSVLEAPSSNQDLPEVFVHKKKRGSKSTLEGHDNMALTAEESLSVARSRMHELLDDAFTLISPSSASIGQNQPPEDEGSYDVRGSSTMKHSPLKMESYKGEPILQTWSPYRAADQVALISMPNKMQTTIGRTPSGRSKRPAADLVGSKSKGNNIPKPAFLKSRDMISTKGNTADLSSTKSQNGNLASRAGKGKSENTDEQEGETTEILQPNDQFEDTEISKENSMLPSIRARKMAKAAKKRVKNGGGGMEMKTWNGQKHKEPFRNVPNGADEIDIISKSVQSAVTPESTVSSIRNEIRSGFPDKNVVTSFSGPGRNSRASGSLVDIA
ncbi:flocculation protein FLO11-like isoform X2 [Mizuhopecten yessoensis]|uniref:Uncharacterized protein n=1 Tax=Mizuhopecten yessoensis TaxID=6573 RepID=A0A210QPV3_MIZYE|nr:flocculation protein FLO11-like isoform X2 [Mizuhopecten yessoensis]OWF50765.1 hypothetical protein KP79_PYT18180 [Mizuhopecten yessoensis]